MRRWIVLLLLGMFLIGCASNPAQNTLSRPQGDSGQITALASSDTPEPSRTRTPTPTLTRSLTPTWTASPSATPSPTPTTPTCSNQAEFVRHLSVSDYSKLKNGTYFAKVWRIKNSGSCSWGAGYQFVFESGDEMGSPKEIPLPKEVLPGETVDIQIVLITPMEPNTYSSFWMLRDPNGQLFGSGENGTQPFSAVVVVEAVNLIERRETRACG